MMDVGRLQRARRRAGGNLPTDPCPPAEDLYDAIAGTLAPEHVGPVVDHLAACAACRTAWTLTREALAHHASRERSRPPNAQRIRWRAAATAAGMLAAASWILVAAPSWAPRKPAGSATSVAGDVPSAATRVAPPDAGVTFRAAAGGASVRNDTTDDLALPRDAFDLRWSVVTDAPTTPWIYRVTVSDAAGRPVHVAAGLATPHLRVPPSAFEGVAPNAVIYWQIEARSPSGHVVRSPAFRQRLP